MGSALNVSLSPGLIGVVLFPALDACALRSRQRYGLLEWAGMVPQTPQEPKASFFSRLGGRVGDLAIEFIATFFAIAGIALADLLVKWWLGAEKKFFGQIPVQWVFDLCHICLVGRLIWRIFFPEANR